MSTPSQHAHVPSLHELRQKAVTNIVPGVSVSVLLFPFEAQKKWRQALQAQQQGGPMVRPKLTRGMTIFAANIVPTTWLQLTVWDQIDARCPTMPTTAKAVLSGAGGAVTATVVENVVVRQQAMTCGPRAAVADMVRQRGARGLLKSYPLIAVRDCIFTVCLFDFTRRTAHLQRDAGFVGQAAMNVPLAVVGAGLSHPFDTVATLMQATHAPTTAAAIARRQWEIGGIRRFYAGYGNRVLLFWGFLTIIPEARQRFASMARREAE